MNPKVIILVLISLWFFSSDVFAQSHYADSGRWQMQLGSGSYGGEKQVGVGYLSSNGRHQSELGYGWTLGVSEKNVEQINFKYVYSPFILSSRILDKRFTTNIVGIGVQVSRWLDERGYVSSPSQYPERYYYAQTRYRSVFMLESHFHFKSIQVYIHSGLLDQWAIAAFNNEELQKEKYIWASGFGLRWFI